MDTDRTIFAISDLHIGDGGPRDNFAAAHHLEQLLTFLDHVATENGELVILGDLFEFWQASLSRVLVVNLHLLDRIASLKPAYVLGNHDADLAAFIGTEFLSHPLFRTMRGPFSRSIGGRQFRFMHGHEVDPYNRGESPGWGRILAIFAGIWEDHNGSPFLATGEPVEEALEQFGECGLRLWNWAAGKLTGAGGAQGTPPSPKHQLTPAQNPDRAVEMLAKYEADKEAGGYDVLVVGHTHLPGRIGDWYINTGSWATTQNNFARILPSGQVDLFDWVDGRPAPNSTILRQ